MSSAGEPGAGDLVAAELAASLAEFVLEGLHCHNRLNKRSKAGGSTYGAG